MKTRIIVSTISLITFTGLAAAEPTVLSTQSGMTIYTFDRDSDGQSQCEAACATIWPPVKPADIEGNGIQTIVRGDGSWQAVYHGEPLYLFIADQKPGDRNGDNVDNAHVVPIGARVVPSVQQSSGYSNGYSSGGYDGGCSY